MDDRCIFCGGPAGINVVERPGGPLHYSRIECSEFLKAENAKLRADLSASESMAIAFEKERDEWSKKTQQANLQAKKLSADRDAMVERLKRHSEERDHYLAECHLLRAALDKAEAAEDLRSLCSDLDAKLRAANLQIGELRKALAFYADEKEWRDTADNYGQVWVFDWPGEPDAEIVSEVGCAESAGFAETINIARK